MRPGAEQVSDTAQRDWLYVSKFPPSPSGIGMYAQVFQRVLTRLGVVRLLRAPADPRVSQRLSAALRGFLIGRLRRMSAVDVVHVELSGRGLFELYFALGVVLRRGRRPILTLTCHDAPSVAGASALFAVLDRPGLRRLGISLSETAGRSVDRRVLARADVVIALTRAGADSLAEQFGRPVHWIPHVVDDVLPAPRKSAVVFVPGYMDDVASTIAVVRSAAAAPPTASGRWSVVVGSLADDVRSDIEMSLTSDELSVTRFLGQATEDELLATYSAAAVVVRLGSRVGMSANRLAASGPLAWALGRHCLCITNDQRAGAAELAAAGLVRLTDDPATELQAVLRATRDPNDLARHGALVAARYGIAATAARYAEALGTDGL